MIFRRGCLAHYYYHYYYCYKYKGASSWASEFQCLRSDILMGNPIPIIFHHRCDLLSTLPSSDDPPHCYSHYVGEEEVMKHKDWLSPNQVIKILENLKEPKSAAWVWKQYRERRDYNPNEALYTVVINKLAQANNLDAIEDIMHSIKLQRSRPPPPCPPRPPPPPPLSNDFFHNVIKIYGHSGGRINTAIQTLLDMPRLYNCWPNVKTFNLVLHMLVSAKLFHAVHEVYLQAPMLGVEIDACSLNILIKGLCENGDLEAAFQVLDEFPKQSCAPNARTFSTLMHGLCRQGKLEEAFGLLHRMGKEGVDADTITFNILISGLRKEARVEEAAELLHKMKLSGCQPNEASYQEVLYALLDLHRFVEAKELMARMFREGFRPSSVSYNKLIRGLCKEELIGDADWVLGQMVRRGFVPKMGLWKLLLHNLFSDNHSLARREEDEGGCRQSEAAVGTWGETRGGRGCGGGLSGPRAKERGCRGWSRRRVASEKVRTEDCEKDSRRSL
ncbi:hypothetical protein Tsubulata_000946 [Turnera subulata]|uniref:Pentacotripeptide-repeat region of PRORP domain-containing protein n=1 Tax=Turnera subulata TaxID=218843 RepID=A0A9Q0G3A5_9ROSI|nr:hypothetical protein Tsubulata_000946 [Turnera subulata]